MTKTFHRGKYAVFTKIKSWKEPNRYLAVHLTDVISTTEVISIYNRNIYNPKLYVQNYILRPSKILENWIEKVLWVVTDKNLKFNH